MLEFLKGLFRYGVAPQSNLAKVAVLFAALSLAVLIEFAFGINVDPIIQIIIDAYNNFSSYLLSRLEPWILIVLEWILPQFDISLAPYWKDLFLLMGIYFLRGAVYAFRQKRIFHSIFQILSGAMLGLTASVAAAVIPVTVSFGMSFVAIAMLPLLAFLLHDLFLTAYYVAVIYAQDLREAQRIHGARAVGDKGYALRFHVRRNFIFFLILSAVVIFSTIIASLLSAPNPGLAALVAVIFAKAVKQLIDGRRIVEQFRAPGEPWFSSYWKVGDVKVGMSVLGVLFWNACIFSVSFLFDVIRTILA